jgi:hypothetical protein
MQNFSVIFHIWPELYDDEVGGLHYDPPLWWNFGGLH